MSMPVKLRKYWSDILRPVLAGEAAPTIPQAVVLRDQDVLLVKRDSPALWELPGGAVLAGESLEDAVRREVREETGVRVEIVDLLGWYDRTGFRAHRSPIFVCRPLQASLGSPADDVVDIRYFPLSDLPRAMFPWYRSILGTDLASAAVRPLQQRQRLGLYVVVQCVWLDIRARLGLIR
jgi:ADP-ribose pyrophosphatase YjhB (NUDIX family)